MKHRLSAILIVTAFLLVVVGSAVLAQTDSWPTFHQSNQRTGVAVKNGSGTGVLGDFRPKPIWVFPAPEQTEIVVDNAGSDLSQGYFRPNPAGSWTQAPLDADSPYGQDDPLYIYTDSDDIDSTTAPKTAQWSFTFKDDGFRDLTLKSGTAAYYVYVWIPSPGVKETQQHIRDARYTVLINGTPIGTYELDQRYGGGWQLLTWQSFVVKSDDTLTVSLSNKSAIKDDNGLPLTQTVLADAVMLRLDAGMVVSSPVASLSKPIVVTTKNENTLAWNSSDFYGSEVTGAVYGLGTDKNSGAGTPDDRGCMVWRFPAADRDFIPGGIGGSAAIWDSGGKELAAVPGGDGQVYVVETGQTGGSVAPLVWRGPGYYADDDPNAEGTLTLSGAFTPRVLFGRRGAACGVADSAARDPLNPDVSAATGTALWTFYIPPDENKDRAYDAYAWIPPAQKDEQFILDAQYERLGSSGNSLFSTKVAQSRGGFWAPIETGIKVPAGTSTTVISYRLTNETAGPTTVTRGGVTTNTEVVADAMKLVPAELGTSGAFDMSSPAVDSANGSVYIGSTEWGDNPRGRLFKLSLGSKDPAWVFPTLKEAPVGGIEGAPSLSPDGSTVYIGSSDGHLYAVNAQSGLLKWRFPDSNSAVQVLGQVTGAASVVNVAGKTIVFISTGGWYGDPNIPGAEGKVYAIEDKGYVDPGNGIPVGTYDVLWSHPSGTDALGVFLYASALLMPKAWTDPFPKVVLGSMDGNLYMLDGQGNGNGTTNRELTVDLSNYIATSAAGTYVSYPKRGTGAPRWSDSPMAFVGAGSRIFGVDLTGGEKDWWWDLKGFTYSSPTVTNYRIYTGDTEGFTWAFSTGTPGSGGTASEDWNNTLGDIPSPGSEPTSASGREAHPEVDIFSKTDWETKIHPLLEEAEHNGNITISSDDLHQYAIGGGKYPGTRPAGNYTLEWGEDFYVVVWNLIDPNRKDPTDLTTWVKDKVDPVTSKWKQYVNDNYQGKVIITIKNNEPGKAGQAMSTITLSGHGQIDYFNDAKVWTDSLGNTDSGFACFWTAKLINVGGSSDSAFSSPGAQFTITAREEPATPNASSLDTPVPADPKAAVVGKDPHLNAPQVFTINNPIGISYTNQKYGATDENKLMGVDAAGITRRSDATAQGNGNISVSPPRIWGGFTPHNKLSDTRTVMVYDRSLLSTTGRRINNFRIQRQDLQWTGTTTTPPHDYRVNPLPWDNAIPLYIPSNFAAGDPPNSSPLYPDMDLRQIRIRSVTNGQDPSQGTMTLTPGKATVVPGPDEPWTVTGNGINFAVQIPRFQPANMPFVQDPSTATAAQLDECGYTSLVYAYVDSNNNGQCDGVGRLGLGSIASTKLTGSTSAEPYRILEVKAHVPADYRAEIEESRVDIGEVPQGFGFTANGSMPQVFEPDVSRTQLDVAPLGFSEWFKGLTVKNIGNVNLPNVAFIRTNMVSDTVQQPVMDGGGQYIPGSGYWIPGGWISNGASWTRDPNSMACVTTTLDPQFMNPATGVPNVPVGSLYYPYRSLHKANVGDSDGPELKIPDCPNWFGTPPVLPPSTLPVEDFPKVSVAMPIGTPVGTYYGKICLGVSLDQNAPDRYTPVSNTADVIATCTESRMTDGSTFPGAPHLAQVDPAPPVLSANATAQAGLDVMPAAFRDPTTGDISLFWSSSRYPTETRGPGDPASSDPWYLYQSKLAIDPKTGFWALQPGAVSNTMQWWVPTDPSATMIPEPADLAAFFPSPTGALDAAIGAPGDVVPSSVRFGSPSVAVDKINGKAYLLFTGQAYKDNGATGPSQRRTLESRAFFSEIKNGAVNPNNIRPASPRPASGSGVPDTGDWTTPKFGIKGAVIQRASNMPPELWSFWYGGGNGKWRIYYNVKTDPSNPSTDWTNEALLPIPKCLSSVAEPSPVVHVMGSSTGPSFYVVYSGVSNYHNNSDIYMSRYTSDDPANPSTDPDHVKVAKAGGWPVSLDELAQRATEIPEVTETNGPGNSRPIVSEKLTRDATKKTWYSRDVDWVADVVSVKDASAAAPTSFEVYVIFNPDPTKTVDMSVLGNPQSILTTDRIYQLNVGSTIKDSATGAIAYSFDDVGDALLSARLKAYFRTVVINPVEGTVKFMKVPTATLGSSPVPINSILVVARYVPRAYRLTTDGVADASPFALLDDDPNPRFGPPTNDLTGLPFFDPGSSSSGSSKLEPPTTDRLWVFWRRPGIDRPGTGIYYKTHRYMVQLDHQIGLKKDTSGTVTTYTPAINNIMAAPGYTALSQPIEVDWVKNRLYFAAVDGTDMLPRGSVSHPFPRKVRVTYVDAGGVTYTNEEHDIQFVDEDLGQSGKTFGNLTSLMVNEGQVSAFKDPGCYDSNGNWIPSNRVWVFWSSTRAGNSDLYFETVSPSFSGKEFK